MSFFGRCSFTNFVYTWLMSYDFTTLPNRRTQPSVKWRDMLEKADVPQGIIPFTIADMEFLTAPEINFSLLILNLEKSSSSGVYCAMFG